MSEDVEIVIGTLKSQSYHYQAQVVKMLNNDLNAMQAKVDAVNAELKLIKARENLALQVEVEQALADIAFQDSLELDTKPLLKPKLIEYLHQLEADIIAKK
jgi:hypothetical protein